MYLSLPAEIELANFIQDVWSKTMTEEKCCEDCCTEKCKCDDPCCPEECCKEPCC